MNKKLLVFTGILFTVSLFCSLFFFVASGDSSRPLFLADIFLKIISLSIVFVLLYNVEANERFLIAKASVQKPVLTPETSPLPVKAPAPCIPKTTFDDVAGMDEVKEELLEVVNFLKNPGIYRSMGATLPKGILFYGPPGTGKTLLARALSGESKASFHYVCGSEFVEKYVGVGAKRVRALFEKARAKTPSIIFIDEIDAVGAKRSSESNNEKEQTLNQLLVEMDGFSSDPSVIILGATNRLDLLDEALLRPGRFDRQIYISSPDLAVREQILDVHFKNKPVASGLSMKSIAKKTSGMTGAHLASIANEAAILAVRFGKKQITAGEVDKAIEKSLAGLERKSAVISESEKQKIALHESGHALLAKHFTTDDVEKISIIPRGMALGYTMQIPEESRVLVTKDELLSRIKTLLGGRAAELLIYNELSSGARDDLKKANEIAREMVCTLGMSKLGNIVFDEWSKRGSSHKIDSEVKAITDYCYQDACVVISQNRHALLSLSQALLEKETLCRDEIDEILHSAGKQSVSV